ncbi:hypothetical protein [Vulgatibacter sp.]|uniref:hypothetical protein n=1 Tax=Vulgatibacter sp. TaxID=1971226 RepID=UPI003567362D
MVRSTALALCPATAAWGALLDIAASVQELPDAGAALALARSVVPQRARRQARRGRGFAVPAGTIVEVLPGPRRGAPLLVPATGAVPGVDEERQGLAVYRVQSAGRIDGRLVREGARVVLSRRRAERGELVAVVDRRSIRLCVEGGAGLAGVPEDGRILGVVEAVIADGASRRCA